MTAAIVLGVCLALAIALNGFILWLAREERKELIDRIMSLSSPISLTTFKAHQQPTESDVSYLDEAREYELNPPADPFEVP